MLNFKDMPISKKLGIGFGIVLVLLFSIVAVAFNSISGIEGNIRSTEEAVEAADASMEAKFFVAKAMDATASYGLGEKEAKDNFAAFASDFDEHIDGLQSLELTQEEKQDIETIQRLHSEFEALGEAYFAAVDAGEGEDAAMEAFDAKADELATALEEFEAMQSAELEHATEASAAAASTAKTIGILLGIIAIVIGVVMAVIITRSITKPIGELVDSSKRVAEGDLSHEIKVSESKDEISVLAASFSNVVKTIQRFRDEVGTLKLRQQKENWMREETQKSFKEISPSSSKG